MSERATEEGHGAMTSGSGAIADARLYLQQRVSSFGRSLFVLSAGLDLFFILLLTVVPPPGEALWTPANVLGWITPLVCFGGLWAIGRRGRPSEALLRTAEVFATGCVCCTFTLVLLGGVAGAAMAIGLYHVSVFMGCTLLLRSALVPSRAWLSLALGVAITIPLVAVAVVVADFNAAPGVGRAAGAAIACAVPGLAFAIVAAIVSRTVYGLQSRVRAALQLGQYTLEEKIGEGGMGAVYKARHALLRRPTAIKLLPADKAGAQAITRFEREVQQTSRLTHPNTVAIYDFGRTPDGVFYYAMEYLDGLSLTDLVDIEGPLPASRVIHLLSQAAEALAEAHGMELIHRDVKPANILVCDRGGIPDCVKVLDFGLVKQTGSSESLALTNTATILGTPLYMAPESLTRPDEVDVRIDIYALGAVAYYLLTGKPVFQGSTLVEVCAHQLHTIPTPPSERLGAPVDGDLEKIVLRCLEKNPDDRPQTALELRDALLACPVAHGWSRAAASAWWTDRRATIATHQKTKHAASEKAPTALTVQAELRA